MANTENMHAHTHTHRNCVCALPQVCTLPWYFIAPHIQRACIRSQYTPDRMTSCCTADQLSHFIRNTCSARACWACSEFPQYVLRSWIHFRPGPNASLLYFLWSFSLSVRLLHTHTHTSRNTDQGAGGHTHTRALPAELTNTEPYTHVMQLLLLQSKIFRFCC